VQMETA